jgi:CcmD family protein
MTDLLGNGKMDVVVTVIAIIFTLLCGYLVMMDLRLRKLENKDKK